jgi:Transglutaminase-like superfamily
MKRQRRLLGSWRFGLLGVILAVLPLAGAIGVWSSRVGDSAILRARALDITAGLTSTSAQISAINDWVYHNKGFGKNRQYFLIPALGPTPLQIMQSGGDCSDKSRLVSAMLSEIGIDSGLVMIYPCQHCGPIHTVVEARDESGYMVVDPVWGVDYPSGAGGFLGMRELAGTRLGREHIADLQRQSATGAKIRKMPAAEATFDYAVAMNWDKNFVTRAVAYALKLLGYAPERALRPQMLEDPKLALTLFLAAAAAGLVGLGAAVGFAFPGLAERFRLPVISQLRRAQGAKRSVPAQ